MTVLPNRLQLLRECHLWLSNKSAPNSAAENHKHLLSNVVAERNSGVTELGDSGSGSLMRLQSSDGLTGADGVTSKMLHKHGCWPGALVLGHVTLSTE